MKYIRMISNLTILMGVMIIAGTAGASDIGDMTVGEALSMVLLGFSEISFGKMLKAVSALKFKKAVQKKGKRVKFFPSVPKVGEIKLEYKKAV